MVSDKGDLSWSTLPSSILFWSVVAFMSKESNQWLPWFLNCPSDKSCCDFSYQSVFLHLKSSL